MELTQTEKQEEQKESKLNQQILNNEKSIKELKQQAETL